MTTDIRTCRPRSRRRVDVANMIVLVIAVASGVLSYLLITHANVNPLIMVPSVVVATLSASRLVTYEAPREK